MAWIFVNQKKFYLHDDETLLAGLIRQGLNPAFQCGAGYCGTCKLQRHANDPFTAEVSFIHEPLVMLEKADILPCNSYVKGVLHIAIEHLASDLSDKESEPLDSLESDDLYEDKLFNA